MQLPPSQAPQVPYRHDIDGLRALAVMLVVAAHVGIWHCLGGYVGVDVFFVISGYLISALLLKELAATGTISLRRFYERRFRRIMPALLVMLVVVSVLAYLIFVPVELKSFAASELGTIFSVSNIVFLHETNYFAPDSRLKPLLHTWSLGVEEQFYLVFPLFMLVLTRWARRWQKVLLWVLTGGVLWLSCYWATRNVEQAFYLAPLRAWEFLLGALLAAKALPTLQRAWSRNAASLAGVVLILVCAWKLDNYSPFPGWRAIAPAVGALLILAAGETGPSLVGQVLAWRPIAFVGLISYSVYLWHWPLQVFQITDDLLIRDHYRTAVAKGAVILGSLVMGALSWKFVEQPFRNGRWRSSRAFLFGGAGVVAVLLCSFSGLLLHTGGWPPAWAPQSQEVRDYKFLAPGRDSVRWGTCFVERDAFKSLYAPGACLQESAQKENVVLYGDSHAAYLAPGLRAVFPDIDFSEIAVTDCEPVLRYGDSPYTACQPASDFLFKDYLLHHAVAEVILVGRWNDWDVGRMGETTQWLKEHHIKAMIIGPLTEFDSSLPRMVRLAGKEKDALVPDRHRSIFSLVLDARMKRLAAREWGVEYVSMYDNLCRQAPTMLQPTPAGCPVLANGVPIFWDSNHFTEAGAVQFAQSMRDRRQLP